MNDNLSFTTPNPSDFVYFRDRLDHSGGDNGFEAPIAKCDRGTFFASFGRGGLIEKDPVSRLKEVDSGLGWPAIDYIECPRELNVPGHNPHIILRPCFVETIPIFIDDSTVIKIVPNILIDGHETPTYVNGKHFPIIKWEENDLKTGQRGYMRYENIKTTNHGDSSCPCFVRVGNKLAFLGQEIFLKGGRSNWSSYIVGLTKLKEKYSSTNWEELRLNDVIVDKEPIVSIEERILKLEQTIKELYKKTGM